MTTAMATANSKVAVSIVAKLVTGKQSAPHQSEMDQKINQTILPKQKAKITVRSAVSRGTTKISAG